MKLILFLVIVVLLVLLFGCVVFVGGDSDSYYGVNWEDCEYNNC